MWIAKSEFDYGHSFLPSPSVLNSFCSLSLLFLFLSPLLISQRKQSLWSPSEVSLSSFLWKYFLYIPALAYRSYNMLLEYVDLNLVFTHYRLPLLLSLSCHYDLAIGSIQIWIIIGHRHIGTSAIHVIVKSQGSFSLQFLKRRSLLSSLSSSLPLPDHTCPIHNIHTVNLSLPPCLSPVSPHSNKVSSA